MQTTERRYDIDALRVLAFGLLILYHTGMLYVSGWDFHLKSSYLSEWLQYPMLLLNRWRMALLFLVSGLAVNFLRSKSPGFGAFIALRSRRLLIPLVFGILVVIPIQPYCEAVTKGMIEPGFLHFLLRYYQFHPWPKGTFTGAEFGFTWNHLWYLPYLWNYTVAAVPLIAFFESALGRRIRETLLSVRGVWLLLLPAVPKAVYLWLLGDRFPPTGDVVHDWYQHAFYFTCFLYGYLLGTDPGIWLELKRLRWVTLSGATLCYFAYVGDLFPHHGFLNACSLLLSGVNTWLWIAAALGWSFTLLNRPMRWVAYTNEAIFPYYILHQSLIILAAYVLVPRHLGPVVEPMLIVALTAAGCAALYEWVIRRVSWLRPAFGLKSLPRAAPAKPLVVAATADGPG